MPSPHRGYEPGIALTALAALSAFGFGAAPAAAKPHAQSGLLTLAPLAAVQGLGQMAHFQLVPHNGQHATATVAVAKQAPHPVTQFAALPAGMVRGVALGSMVLPARLVDPVVTYQPRRKGPIVELGVAGGGMPTGAGLAHVGMHWKF